MTQRIEDTGDAYAGFADTLATNALVRAWKMVKPTPAVEPGRVNVRVFATRAFGGGSEQDALVPAAQARAFIKALMDDPKVDRVSITGNLG